jgi:hypothetical protein
MVEPESAAETKVAKDIPHTLLSLRHEITLRNRPALHYAWRMQQYTLPSLMTTYRAVFGSHWLRLILQTALGVFATALVGCQALTPQDDRVPLQTQGASFQSEVAMLQTSSAQEMANAQATFDIARTEIAVDNAVNQQLLSTLSIRITPTPRLTTDNMPDDMGLMVTPGAGASVSNAGDDISTGATAGSPAPDAGSAFLVTGTASSVRESDGCVETTANSFSIDAPRVYATFVANNLQAGTALRVDWTQNGETMYFSDWTPDQNYPQICVWFFITNADVAFVPGSWSARVLANDQLVGEIPFTFESAPGMLDMTQEATG